MYKKYLEKKCNKKYIYSTYGWIIWMPYGFIKYNVYVHNNIEGNPWFCISQ